MIPIKDENPQLRVPYVTYALIAMNIAVWFALQNAGFGPRFEASLCAYGLVPGNIFMDGWAREVAQGFCASRDGVAWSGVVSSMFMHGSWMHIIGNMWFLYIFGDNIEDAMGPIRFLAFYLLSGFAAALAQIYSDTQSLVPMVGASGAIGGVMGGYIALYPKVRVHLFVIFFVIFTTIQVPAWAMLGYWLLLQILGGISSIGASGEGGVAFWAHLGGFVAGVVLSFVLKNDKLLKRHPYYGWNHKRHF